MITADDVVEVSRTGRDHPELSLTALVAMTGAKDWDGPGLFSLTFGAASEIAAVINTNNSVTRWCFVCGAAWQDTCADHPEPTETPDTAAVPRRVRRKKTSAGATNNGDA